MAEVATVGQTASLVGLRFVEHVFKTVTGTGLSVDQVVQAARKDGASAIVEWLHKSKLAEQALGPMLRAAHTQYTELQSKCNSRKRRFSVSNDECVGMLVTIDGVGPPPREAKRFSAAAVIYNWFPENVETAISPPHSVKAADEYYAFLHEQWEKLSASWIYTVAEALQCFGGVDMTATAVSMNLAPYQALFDCLFFVHRAPVVLSRSVTQPEAVEVSLARPKIQQSLKDAMAIFSKSNTSVLPATTASRDALYRVRSALIQEAWEASFEAGVVSLPEEAFTVVPVSTVMHENEQLKFDRGGVPLCCNGANCVAMSYPQLCRPLNKYLYPHEQQHFNENGVLPDEMAIPGECLLCIRDSIHIVVRVGQASIMDAQRMVGRPTVITPPFQNLVGPGGYRPDCCLLSKDTPDLLNVDVVGSHLMPLKMTYSPTESRWFLDQSDLVWNPSN